jgi:SnoaL-like domain
MRRCALGLAVVALGATCLGSTAAAAETTKLTAQDILDIRQLIDAYPHLLDHCVNGGNDYAELFTPDATFGVSSEWGRGVKVWFRGREALARAGGGGPNGCRPERPNAGYHLNINPVITPTPGGAHAISTLLTITSETGEEGDRIHWEGGYEDTFEKTAAGWRFKSRVHVWPEIQWTDRPEDMPPRDLKKE